MEHPFLATTIPNEQDQTRGFQVATWTMKHCPIGSIKPLEAQSLGLFFTAPAQATNKEERPCGWLGSLWLGAGPSEAGELCCLSQSHQALPKLPVHCKTRPTPKSASWGWGWGWGGGRREAANTKVWSDQSGIKGHLSLDRPRVLSKVWTGG